MKKLVLATLIAASSTGVMAVDSAGIEISDQYNVPETCTLTPGANVEDAAIFGETKSFSIETNVANGKATYAFSNLVDDLPLGNTTIAQINDAPIALNNQIAINNGDNVEFKFTNDDAQINNVKYQAGDYEAKVTVTASCIK